MSKTKIMLTGSGGFLGSRLYKAYKDKYNIIALKHKDLDIIDHYEAQKVIKDITPDIIIHAAGMSATKACEENPELAFKVNVDASINIANAAKKIGARMLFVSSEQVFNGNVDDGPYNENNIAVPSTVYGETKLKAEEMLRKEIDELYILRLSWMFGLPERGVPNNTNLMWKLLNATITNKPIKIADNEYRGITYIYDLIDNLDSIFELPYSTYHFGSINEKSTYKTAVFILEQMGVPMEKIEKIIIKDDEKYKDKMRDLRLSYEKIKSYGININSSDKSIQRALREFDFKSK